MKHLFLLIIIIAPYLSLGQESKIPDEILCTPVLLITDRNQGSGIFMDDGNYFCFVTARHNLFFTETINKNNKQETVYKLLPQTGKLIFYSHNIVKDAQSIIDIDIKNSYKDSLIIFDKNQDIAIIVLGIKNKIHDSLTSILYTKYIQRNNSSMLNSYSINGIRKYDDIKIGGDIFLFGFPCSIGLQENPQFDYYRPLLRKGIISGKFEKNKTIIIDSPSYFGNSGGPVIEKIVTQEGTILRLIGLVSQFIPYIEEWKNQSNGFTNIQSMNSGYSIITSSDYVVDLFKKIK